MDELMKALDTDIVKARANWEDAVAHSLRIIAETSHASDKAILEVVNNLVKKVLELQHRVDLLEDLHRLEENK
jgi:hypothetical protein